MTHLKLWFSIWDRASDPLTEALDSELELVFTALQRIQLPRRLWLKQAQLFCFLSSYCKMPWDLKRITHEIAVVKNAWVWIMQLACSCELCDHSVFTFRSLTKTLWCSALISPFVDNNNPLQHVTYPLTATCTAKHHRVNNFLIVLWLWNWTPVLEGKLKNHAALSRADWLVSFCRLFSVWRTKD